jgi:hypothetical protein
MQPEVNPYAPPAIACVQTRNRNSTGSLTISVVSGIGALAFIAFSVILLRSSLPDRKAGTMFLVNVPVLIGLAVSAVRSRRISVYFAASAACIQIAITIAMLMMVLGDAALVIGINSAIILACLAIALWAWLSNRRSVWAEYSTQDGG